MNLLGAEVRLIGPPTLIPPDADRWGAEVFHDLDEGLENCDAVMALRLQKERMIGADVPSEQEFAALYGLSHERMKRAVPGALVMHPGPINRGVEISSELADDPEVSLIWDQVDAGMAMRMAILETLGLCTANRRDEDA